MNNRSGIGLLCGRLFHSPWRCAAVLGAVALAALFVIGLFSYQRSGSDGLIAAIIAASVCWIGATGALFATAAVARHPSNALTQLMLAIFFRTALPFGVGVLISSSSGWLAEAGTFGLIVAFYLIMLATETFLSVNLINRSAETSKAT